MNNYEEDKIGAAIDKQNSIDERKKRFLLDDAGEYKEQLRNILHDLSKNQDIVDTVTSNCRHTNDTSTNIISKYPNILNWLKNKEKEYSYGRENNTKKSNYDIENTEEKDKQLKEYMKGRDIKNVMLNHVLEHIVLDLIRDIVHDITKDMEHIKKIEMRKTNEYDDVFGKTDYVLLFTTGNLTTPFAIDLTTISDETKIKEKEDARPETTLFDLSTHHADNIKIRMKRRVLPIDKQLAFSLIEMYLNKIKKGESINRGDTIKMLKNNINSKENIIKLKTSIQEKTADLLKKKKRRRITQINIDKKQPKYKRVDISI